MECPYCHSQVPEGASFCQNCGATISNQVKVNEPIQTPVVEEKPINNNYNNSNNGNRKKKTSTFSTFILILILAGLFIGYKMLNKEPKEDNTSKYEANENNNEDDIVSTDDSFVMYIEDTFYIDNDYLVVTGRVNRGTVKTGDTVQVIGNDREVKKLKVKRIEQFRKVIDEASKDDNVGIIFEEDLERDDLERGQAVVAVNSMKAYKEFEAEIKFITKEESGSDRSYTANDEYNFFFYSATTDGKITLPDGVSKIEPGDTLTIKVKLDHSVAMEAGSEFTIRDGVKTIGNGTVKKGI